MHSQEKPPSVNLTKPKPKFAPSVRCCTLTTYASATNASKCFMVSWPVALTNWRAIEFLTRPQCSSKHGQAVLKTPPLRPSVAHHGNLNWSRLFSGELYTLHRSEWICLVNILWRRWCFSPTFVIFPNLLVWLSLIWRCHFLLGNFNDLALTFMGFGFHVKSL